MVLPLHLRPRRPGPLLLLSRAFDRQTTCQLRGFVSGLPLAWERPLRVELKPELSAWRGRLLSSADRGTPVHAAAFLRERRIVLESTLLLHPPRLRVILAHELFHFVWIRLGNSRRLAFQDLLTKECAGRARGELGESAEMAKHAWRASPSARTWKQYVLESFCDSGAFLYAGGHRGIRSLAPRWLHRRRTWFQAAQAAGAWPC